MLIRRMRRRRANSDSDLSLLDSMPRHNDRKPLSFDDDVPMMQHSVADDIDIDILGDSAVDSHLFNGVSTMDPSQMFVISNLQNIFPSTPQNTTMGITSNMSLNDEHSISSSPVLGESSHDHHALFPNHLYLINSGLEGPLLCVDNNQGVSYSDEPVSSIYDMEITKESVQNAPISLNDVKVEKEPVSCQTESKSSSGNNKRNAAKKESSGGENRINKQWINDKIDLKKKGCKWKSGLWSNDEEQLLRKNIDNYCKKMNLPDPIKMIYFTPKEERKEFYRSIATGINRPLFTIYRKVLRIYDSKNYIGKYSPEEVEKLEKYSQVCPKDWKSIGLLLGRSASSVKDRARLIKPRIKRGRWNDCELKLLSKIIRELTKTREGESVTDGINWVEVAKRIGTRTSKQCRMKWLTYLNWKEAGGKEWYKIDEVELINRVVKANVDEENMIDWNRIANGWACVRSPQWLRQKWWQIKSTVPNYQSCKFSELLENLQSIYIPELLSRLQDIEGHDIVLEDSKNSQIDQNALPTMLPGDMGSLDMHEPLYGRYLPLNQYEFQCVMTGEHNQRILTLVPNNIDLATLNSNEPLNHSKLKDEFVDNLKTESINRTMPFDNVMNSLSDENGPSFSEALPTVSVVADPLVGDICHDSSNTNDSLFTA